MKGPAPRDLVGRDSELEALRRMVDVQRPTVVVVYGPSGIGKTRLAEEFCAYAATSTRFREPILQTIYRTNWTAALAQLKKYLASTPSNATRNELEDALVGLAVERPLLLVLDNVDRSNVAEVRAFAEKWSKAESQSALVLTAQEDVRAALPRDWQDLRLSGLTAEEDVLALLGELRTSLPIQELRQIGETLEGNPQRLLFLRWLEPSSVARLQESAAKLMDMRTAEAVEDLVDQTSLSSLFFLALGVHKDLNISEELLATLWDHFGSRGAEPFVRAKRMLVEMGFLAQTKPGSYRLHESVHVSLPKALQHRVGNDRIPSLHHYFAEHYRRMLHRAATSTALTHFVYHAHLARDYRLAYETLIARGIAEELAGHGTALQVLAELESLAVGLAAGSLTPVEMASVYLVLGRLCNDLSSHAQALEYMAHCESCLDTVAESTEMTTGLQRDAWYVQAVAYSNTGQSDSCLQHYFKIVDSCCTEADPLACLSLGYLAHDLKYRDIDLAAEIGGSSVEWARAFPSGGVLAKNLCSYAETLAAMGRFDQARPLFVEAETLARAETSQRELGRVLTNFGFSQAVAGDPSGRDMIRRGTEVSRRLGDRRRHFQGMLYGGVATTMAGDAIRGRTEIRRAAQGFESLGDGRYFVPALLWTLQIDNEGCGEPAENMARARPDVASLVHCMDIHPNFGVYVSFWERHLSKYLGADPNVEKPPLQRHH